MSTLTQFFGSGGGSGIPVELLVVGGGGSGSAARGGGASVVPPGGAGRLIYLKTSVLFADSTTVEVGAGGAGSSGSSGSTSSAFGAFFTAQGGMGWAATAVASPFYSAGSCRGSDGANSFAVTATTGLNFLSLASNGGGTNGSGGGAGGTGLNGTTAGGAAAGPGLALSITGSSVTYAAGGRAAGDYDAGPSGTANTGSGGGGSGRYTYTPDYNGGSGVVVIAYPNTFGSATCTGTYNEPTRTGYRVYRFTGSGTITFPAS